VTARQTLPPLGRTGAAVRPCTARPPGCCRPGCCRPGCCRPANPWPRGVRAEGLGDPRGDTARCAGPAHRRVLWWSRTWN